MNRRYYAGIAVVCFMILFIMSFNAPEFADQKPDCGDIVISQISDTTDSRTVDFQSMATHPNIDKQDSLQVRFESDKDGEIAKGSVTLNGEIKASTEQLSDNHMHTITMTVSDEAGRSCYECEYLPIGSVAEGKSKQDCIVELSHVNAKPWDTVRDDKTISGVFPFGADDKERPLSEYATQGARIIAFPAVISGCLVAILAILGGLLRCTNTPAVEGSVQAFSELVGALPRLVIILVMVMLLPKDQRSMLPIGIVWALLSAPSAMDEAGAVASRLGGSRFVECLRAHGFGAARIYLYHIVGLNLRPVVVRQAAEVIMQLAFLEVALSFLAEKGSMPNISHTDNLSSWGELLEKGYSSLILDQPTMHALILGLGLLGVVVLGSTSLTKASRAR